MIFARDDAALIRQGKLTAALVPTSSKIKPNRVRALRRRFTRHDNDGKAIGTSIETVEDYAADGGRQPVVITILEVNDITVDDLTLNNAKACGYRTLGGLKAAWMAEHPQTADVKIVHFAVGDLTDRDRFLNYTGVAGGDYTSNRHRAADDAAALTDEQLAWVTKLARTKDRDRAKHPDQQLRDGLMRELEQWQARSGGITDRDRAQTIRGIRRQIAVLDRKLKAA